MIMNDIECPEPVGICKLQTTPISYKPNSNLCLSDGNCSNYSVASTVVITESEMSCSVIPDIWKDFDEQTNSANSSVQTKAQVLQQLQEEDSVTKPVSDSWKRRKRLEKLATKLGYILVTLFLILLLLTCLSIYVYFMYNDAMVLYRGGRKHNNESYLNATNITETEVLHPNLGWSLNGFENLMGNTSVEN